MKKLPRKGYKSITVTDKVFNHLQGIAEARGLSVPGVVRAMLVKAEKFEDVKSLIQDIQTGGHKLSDIVNNLPDDMKGSMAKQYWNAPMFSYGIEYGALTILNHLKEAES